MGWEKRGKRTYYYAKTRIGKRVFSQYVGRGHTANRIAQITELGKERAALAREEARQRRAELRVLASAPPELEQVLAEARRATVAALTGAGYHQHKREWRRQRAESKNASADGIGRDD